MTSLALNDTFFSFAVPTWSVPWAKANRPNKLKAATNKHLTLQKRIPLLKFAAKIGVGRVKTRKL